MAPEVWSVEQGALRIAGFRDTTQFLDPEEEAVREITSSLQRHLDAGKSIAYYVNQDLGHPDIGMVLAFTYGTPEAQFEPEQFPDGPPKQCPDGIAREITGGINWRYQLEAITPNLPDISDPQWDKPTTRIWVALDIAAEGPDGVVVVESILNEADEVIGWHIVNPANEADRLEFNEIAERLRVVFEEQGPMEELPFGRSLNHLHGHISDITSENVIGHVEATHPGMDRLDADWRLHPLIAHEADHSTHDFKSVVPPESPAFTSPLGEHLIEQHGYQPQYVAVKLREDNKKHLVDQHDVLHSDPTADSLPKDHNHDTLQPEDL